MNVVIFGAGAVGRGLLAPLFLARGASVAFVEPRQAVAEPLERLHHYTRQVGLEGTLIEPVSVLTPTSDGRLDLRSADAVLTAVRVENLGAVGRLLAKCAAFGLLRDRTPVVVVENTPNAGEWLRELSHTGDHFAFSHGIAECVIPPSDEADPTFVVGDPAGHLLLEARKTPEWLEGGGVERVDRFAAAWAQKWLLHCGLHALVAYQGLMAEEPHALVREAATDPGIRLRCDVVMRHVVVNMGPRWPGDHLARLVAEWQAMADPANADTCARVARDARRKASKGERLQALLEMGGDAEIVGPVIEFARTLTL